MTTTNECCEKCSVRESLNTTFGIDLKGVNRCGNRSCPCHTNFQTLMPTSQNKKGECPRKRDFGICSKDCEFCHTPSLGFVEEVIKEFNLLQREHSFQRMPWAESFLRTALTEAYERGFTKCWDDFKKLDSYQWGKREAIEEAIKLSDEIEAKHVTSMEEWKAFKRFRNTLRDRLQAIREMK